MGNVLACVAELITSGNARTHFRSDPRSHLEARGLGDLTGEDVDEALAVIRDQVPPALASVLDPDRPGAGYPPVAPIGDRQPVDAAVRLLRWIIDSCHPDEASAHQATGEAQPAGANGSVTPMPPAGENAPVGS